ncbi:predicted protein [Botrytis cinerea T4]|uniref:Uncharacterized protein n=1 Tax=Botryotinia fuckeliana (strain T4) TaxID=999810 RepID=G2YPC4_BOTF4|nr:predicted protein [Botrytis cinerea T4]
MPLLPRDKLIALKFTPQRLLAQHSGFIPAEAEEFCQTFILGS